MKSRDFCYWLQGFFELSDQSKEITIEQSKLIQRHLNMVFAHEIDPSMPDVGGVLQALHDGKIPNLPSFTGFNNDDVKPGDVLLKC